jgi:hypothetical protein
VSAGLGLGLGLAEAEVECEADAVGEEAALLVVGEGGVDRLAVVTPTLQALADRPIAQAVTAMAMGR